MMLSNPPKALIVLTALVCVTILMLTSRIEPETGAGLLGLIVGYGIGNGIAAAQGDPIKPIFDTKNPARRSEDGKRRDGTSVEDDAD